MAKSKEELLEKLSECVVEMEDEEVVEVFVAECCSH